MSLPLNEIFETIQGEAQFTGTPSVFVRLQGCDVGCPWCDTKYTWAEDATKEVSLSTVLAKVEDSPTYSLVGVDTLIATIKQFRSRHIVITGGEPAMHDLTDLTTRLTEQPERYTVQIETSATAELRCHRATWVTVSPKFNMPGRKPVLDSVLDRADEIKMPIGRQADISALTNMLAEQRRRGWIAPTIWLQPLSTNKKATELCIEAVTQNNWRLSIQTHKFINIR